MNISATAAMGYNYTNIKKRSSQTSNINVNKGMTCKFSDNSLL